MRNNKEIQNPFVGMKIKIGLPTTWCQVYSRKQLQWLKGKVIEVCNPNTIVVSCKSKKVGKIDRLMCFRKKDTFFNKIIEIIN